MQLILTALSQPLKLWEGTVRIVRDGSETGHCMSRIEDFLSDVIVISGPVFFKGKSSSKGSYNVAVHLTRDIREKALL